MEEIQLDIYNSSGQVIHRKKMTDEGMVSSFNEFPKTRVKKAKAISLFNPFYFFDIDIELHKLIYTIKFKRKGELIEIVKEVYPIEYPQKTTLSPPLHGSTIIDTGYDHFAHHRRMNTTHWGMRLLKISQNVTQYAIDFAPVNAEGRIFDNDGKSLGDYMGFGQNVYVPGEGKIIEVIDSLPDNLINGKLAYGTVKFIKNPKLASGNYIVIDHLNGEVSLLAHLKRGSINVKLGEIVVAGQALGQVGNSGDSTYPHLHYQLENEHSVNVQTYPAKFSNLKKINNVPVDGAQYFNTGDIIEHLQ